MPRHKNFIPHGVIPAVILPFHDDLSIDEASFRKHLRDVTATEGLSAVTINAHSTEVASCTFDEQKRVLDIAQDEIGAKLPIVNGIWADGSLEAARIAKMATAGGASALLVFPPAPFTLGQNPAMAVEHFKRIADASDLPIIAFQYPLATGQGYPNETLLRMVDEVPTIRAIKDWAGTVQQHEWHVRNLQSLARPVNVLSTQSSWLMASLVLGCNGLLSGSGSVIPDLQAQLFRAVQAGDLNAAQAHQRPHLSARQRVLCAAVGRHAQPHEGGAGAARPAAARRGAAAAGQDRARRDRAHPQGAGRGRHAAAGRGAGGVGPVFRAALRFVPAKRVSAVAAIRSPGPRLAAETGLGTLCVRAGMTAAPLHRLGVDQHEGDAARLVRCGCSRRDWCRAGSARRRP